MGKNALFDDYDAFVEKFRPKKTTDDCYTPPKVYEAVLDWARNRYGIPADAPIVRPFFPGGDYENADYPAGCHVVDNPPFSIMAKIVRFYQERKIPFFLFANGLTLFNALSVKGVGAVVVRRSVVFENGANVNVGFLTNLGGNVMEIAPELDAAIKAASARRTPRSDTSAHGKIVYPDAVISAATAKRLVRPGVRFAVRHGEAAFIRKMDAQGGEGIFGGGLLLSERAAAEKAAAEKAAARVFALSPREREMQRLLGRAAERAADSRSERAIMDFRGNAEQRKGEDA